MKKHFGGFLCFLLIFSVTIISWKPLHKNKSNGDPIKNAAARELLEKYVDNIYLTAHLQETGLDFDVFKKAITGFINLKRSEKLSESSNILTVIDYTKSSREKRMWIVDIINKTLVLNTWVAHGKGSGNEVATSFSDRNDSHKSSLGFYLTDDIYYGEHGRSLKLDGLDEGFNTSARKRSIVVHAAEYVNEDVIALKGCIGRSFGCPAVAPEVVGQVIDAIKNKTVMFIYGQSSRYSSKYLNEDLAADFISSNSGNDFLSSLYTI